VRYAIFSDIHSNLEALQAVLKDAQKQEAQVHICLGDLVGYNADPKACVEIVRALECPVIKGNHDEAATHVQELPHFNPLAMAGIKHSRSQLTLDLVRYLNGLPMQRDFKEFTCVHSSLHEPENWHYVATDREAWHCLQQLQKSICFIGHTHGPIVCFDDHTGVNILDFEANQRLYLAMTQGRKFLVNVGSVGQPRDGDWRACYAIYDTLAGSLEIRRVKYDLELAQQKILDAGLPEALAQRLMVGR
jgi:predicted phosphodiesterase